MSLPTLTKTWQFNTNQRILAQGTVTATSKRFARILKNSFISFPTNPWTVRYSCDSVTAGTVGDGIDRLTSDSNIVFSSGAHSWIVLRQSNIGFNLEICLDFSSNTVTSATIVVSWGAGFTGGTTTTRPTATDEQIMIASNTYGMGNSGQDNDIIINAQQSTDGYCTRIWTYTQSINVGFFVFDRLVNSVSGWNPPCVAIASATASGNSAGLLSLLASSAASTTTLPKARNNSSSLNFSTYLTTESTAYATSNLSSNLILFPNDIDNTYPIFEVGLYSTTPGVRGHLGTMSDFWAGSMSVVSGCVYPNDGTRQFIEVSNFILPGDGYQPVML